VLFRSYGEDHFGKKKPEKDVEATLYVDWVFRIPKDVTPEGIVFRRIVAEITKTNSMSFKKLLELKTDALRQKPPKK